MADNARRVVMRADLGPRIGLVHDVAEDKAGFHMFGAGAVAGRHETLVVIALDPDRAARPGDLGKRLPVVGRHPRPGGAVMENIAEEQQPFGRSLGDHGGEPGQRLRRVIGRQELSRAVIACRLFQVQVAKHKHRGLAPEQRARGVELEALAGEFSGSIRHWRRG